jgi:hypothetical protein
VNWTDLINEGSLLIALIVTVVALTIIVVVSGADSLAATGLRDLGLILGGALAGAKMPKA